ncbi:hypothetical protein OQA88_10301 [Cercophora sp. LCS_1]
MVKFSVLALAAASVLPLASAEPCKTGLYYCGSTLMKIGDYGDEIRAELTKNGYPHLVVYGNNSLYSCGVGGKGWIGLVKMCDECVDGGAGKSDYCRRYSRA